ncbi:MAG: CaiB/BaiF CoA-transferase family protein [Pseudomonadota bacterium]
MTSTPEQTGPLRGLRIVEFGHFIAAPFATRVLGDLGAEIIKVEPPNGDPIRGWGGQLDGKPLWWSSHARNKKLVTLNLKAPEARQIALDLIAASDAVIENFRPGLMERFGLGPDDAAAVKPGCAYVRVSGFGQTGPRAKDPSFGMIGEALGGIRYLTGYPHEICNLPPVRTGVSLGDTVAGLYGAVGILAALHEVRGTVPPPGTPARIVDVALTESVLSLLEGILPEYGATGKIRKPAGARLPAAVPSSAYPTGDGAFVLIGANSDPLFARLCKVMGREELIDDPRFVDNPARVANIDAIDAVIEAWTRQHTTDQILAALAEPGIPSSKIYSAADIVADAQYQARDAVRPVPDAEHGQDILHSAPVPRFPGDNPEGIAWAGGAIGQHNTEVYGALLGLDADRLNALRDQGII